MVLRPETSAAAIRFLAVRAFLRPAGLAMAIHLQAGQMVPRLEAQAMVLRLLEDPMALPADVAKSIGTKPTFLSVTDLKVLTFLPMARKFGPRIPTTERSRSLMSQRRW